MKKFLKYFYAELLTSSPRLFRAAAVTLGMVIFFFFMHILSCLNTYEFAGYSRTFYAIGQWFAMMICGIFICKSFVQFQRPLSASFSLMLPVSKGHKFITALLINIVILPVLLWGVVFGSNLIISLFTDTDLCYLTQNSLTNLMINLNSRELHIATFFVWSLSIVSSYVYWFLVAILFRRAQFGWSVLIAIVTLIIGSFIVYYVAQDIVREVDAMSADAAIEYMEDIAELCYYGYSVFWMVTIPLMLLWSWKRFKTLKIKR